MAGEDLIEIAKRGYAAFAAGDAEAAMADLADDIVWVTPGNSTVSGEAHGKQEVGALWAKFAEKGLTIVPEYWFSDGERVVCLNRTTIEGETADVADVLTFRNGKVVKFQTAGDTALTERIFGSK
jgi:ketosteroid isomerase-like protein